MDGLRHIVVTKGNTYGPGTTDHGGRMVVQLGERPVTLSKRESHLSLIAAHVVNA